MQVAPFKDSSSADLKVALSPVTRNLEMPNVSRPNLGQ